MLAAALVFSLSTLALAADVEPVATWYFSLAWWSYIVFADAALARARGRGVLLGTGEAPALLAGSIAIWLSFEIYNLRLANWRYLELPASTLIRWPGYAIAFATVLPGILVTAEWIERFFPEPPGRAHPITPHQWQALFWGGLLASLLPWLAPRYFFPLVWLGPTVFFAALNHRWARQGILDDLATRGPGRLYRLLAAGAVCGFLWETWNFWARSKWVYQVPFFDQFRLFEMPLAGYLGFPPFAVECREMYLAGRWLAARLPASRSLQLAAWSFLLFYFLAAFWAIDRFTVASFL
ncbi:MAG: hypothetical protein L0191_07695 [Acidobacteria bacterium]|nr:hypothetical protein [Acidobacteriota bacterium]